MKFILPGKTRPLSSPKRDWGEGGFWAQRRQALAGVARLRLSGILVPTDFSPGSGAALHGPLPKGFQRYRFIDVSREPADGNPNHSGDSVLRVPKLSSFFNVAARRSSETP